MRTNRAGSAGTPSPTRSFSTDSVGVTLERRLRWCPEAPRTFARSALALVLTSLVTLSACSPAGPADSNVQVTSPTVTPNGQLSLNATATFAVSVQDPDGLYQAEDLRYHWSLDEERGTFLLDGGGEATEAATTESSLRVRGDRAGIETVRVTVVDDSTDTTVGVGTLTFDITSPSSTPSLCFDSTTLFVAYGYPPNRTDTIDLDTGERNLLVTGLVFSVSRDGNWITGIVRLSSGYSQVFMQRCDGAGLRLLTNGEHYDETPRFAPDGQSIYFRRRSADENVLYPGDGRPGFFEFGVIDVATGDIRMLTNLNASAGGSWEYAVSPDGETIVFEHSTASRGSGGMAFDFRLVTMPAGGGPLHSLTDLGNYIPLEGIDWSPDGKDIIFSWRAAHQTGSTQASGIFRIHPTAGGGPQLIFADPSEQNSPPSRPAYYAGGTRIAWSGQEYGQSTIEVWSIDANGGDVRQLTTDVGSARLMAVWEP